MIFNLFIKKSVPYTGALGSEVLTLSPGYAEVKLKDRRGVRNHLNSVHAMALANLGEFATGLALISALPNDMRGILKGFQIEYLKKARGELKATSKVELITKTEKQDLEVIGEITDASGALVTQVKALWRVDKNKKG